MASDNVITYLLELEDKVSKELKETAKNADALQAELSDLRKEQKKGIKADEMRAQAMAGLKTGLLAAAASAAAVGGAFLAMGAHAVGTSANLEGFETRLGVLLGGLDKGKARVQELFELSASTPFSIQGLVESDAALEAFGVNADRVRGGVMDLAGATGMELTAAANAVGKALAGGAGAADVLREKGVLAMVEVQAGMATAEMTTDQFREALLNTLETNEKIAGGTALMAQTYDGLMSTLKDQFTVFSKQVGDAKLFSTAKATLFATLELLGENKEGTASFAETVGGALANALITVVDISFKIAAVIMRIREGWLTIKQIVYVVGIAYLDFYRAIFDGLSALPLIGDTFKGIADTMASGVATMNKNLHQTAGEVDAAREAQDKLLNTGEKLTGRIKELAGEYQNAADASKGIKVPEGNDEIMKIAGIDTKALKKAAAVAKKAQAEIDKFGKSMTKLGGNFNSQAAATRKPLKESEKLQNTLADMANEFANAQKKATELGPQAVAAFDKVKTGMINSMGEMAAAIPKAKGAEFAAAAGAGMSGAADVMSSGGMGLLASAGPMGAGASALIGIGQQGEEAYQAEVADEAQSTADERAAELQKKADKMKAAGASEQALAAQGLSAEDIAQAGEVTDKDIAGAEGEVDRGEVMAEQVKNVVTGVIDGISALLEGLPDILSTLIPLLLIDLPMSLIEAIPALIEELIPVLLFELPKGIITMLIKVVPKILKMLFMDLPVALFKGIAKWWTGVWKAIKDLFSFGFQTGGYVPKTSNYILHQGERVVPASGAGTGTASKGLAAFGMGGGRSLTVNTQVVHPDSIATLSTLIDDEMGAHGRSTVPIWGSSSISRSI